MFNLQKLSALLGMFSPTPASAIPLANRNLATDGRFDFWSAASAALATAGGYSPAVLYLAGAGTGGAGSVAQTDLRQAGLPYTEASAQVAYVHNQTTGSTGTVAARTAPFTLLHRIEQAQVAAGRSVTLSVKLWVTSGSITIPAVVASQYFGNGGSPSAGVTFDKAINWVVTTTPKKFSVRVDVPSVIGKTFGTSGGDYMNLGLWLPPGVTFSLVASEYQIELSDPNSSSDINGNGGAPTTFEFRGLQAEGSRVARFYETLSFPGSIVASVASCVGTSNVWATFPFSTTKRSLPAATFILGTSTFNNASNVYSISGISTLYPTTTLLGVSFSVSGSPVGNTAGGFVGNSAAIILDSRL